MSATKISKLKVGDYSTFNPTEEPTERQVYVRGEYDTSIKNYEDSKFADCGSFNFAKLDQIVNVDFIF